MKSLKKYIINETLLKDSFSIYPYEWEDFKNNINKEFKNKYTFGKDKDIAGEFEYMMSVDKDIIAKFYVDEYEVSTNITKSDFHKIVRGEVKRIKFKL